ncbi:uncharacterized protein LOC128963208 [Oppia nitens]|uniref:uncharacterized protein LOC128963208 n=1 Tax=Oppia nitens TaxID=1686743 RepID=UPI0023DAF685|nr:uncharacterized protein LOC128963208 [Oppia nitens]
MTKSSKILYQNIDNENEKKMFNKHIYNNIRQNNLNIKRHPRGGRSSSMSIIIIGFIVIIIIIVILLTTTGNKFSEDYYFDDLNQTVGQPGDSERTGVEPVVNYMPELMSDGDAKIVDCGLPSDGIYPEIFTLSPNPLNLYSNWTVNLRFKIRRPVQWNTNIRIKVEKLLFGIDWLRIPIPCFLDYFGSCDFNICKVQQIHWDEQLCDYIQEQQNINCHCPDIFKLDHLYLDQFIYKPRIDRIMKYFSWIASGWYRVTSKVYNKRTNYQYMCLMHRIKLDASDNSEDKK